MIIGVVTASISIPGSRSLKEKRMIIKSLKDRIVHKMNVSAAEVGHQDAWQLADLAFVTVAGEKQIVDQRLAEVSSLLRHDPRFVLINLHTEIL
jgi:uncharacterized protein YlxP (DUF503 family)